MEVVASCTRDIGESSCSGRSASNSSFAVIQRPAKRKRSTPKESLSRRASSRASDATTDTLPDPDIADVNCSIWTNHLRTPTPPRSGSAASRSRWQCRPFAMRTRATSSRDASPSPRPRCQPANAVTAIPTSSVWWSRVSRDILLRHGQSCFAQSTH